MGAGYRIACNNCGLDKEILIGSGMLLPDVFKDDILEGKFGQDAKAIMEEHPDWDYWIDHRPFSCNCNYVTGFPVVIFITDEGKEIKCDRHRCAKCGKTMRANSWGKGVCWRCGGKLSMYDSLMWD